MLGTPGGPQAGAPPLWAGLVTACVVGANLRTAVVAVPPVLSAIQASLSLSSAVAGLLTTVPLLCFGAFAIVAPLIARRAGLQRTLAAGMVLVAGGSALRMAPGLAALFAGTLLVGMGAALGNVLLPALVKRDHPGRVGLLTGSYSMFLTGGAAIAAGVAVPLSRALGGWRPQLGVWAAPAAVALAVVAVLDRPRGLVGLPSPPAPDPPRGQTGAMLRRRAIAWQLTASMGLQSFVYYSAVTWMPTVFESHGSTPAGAGLLLSVAGIVGIPVTLVTPVLAGRGADQRGLAACGGAVTAVGVVGLAFAAGAAPYLWAVLIGSGTSISFALSLTMISLRAGDARVAADLSGMAQSFGYLFAAAGPFLVGLVHDLAGGWVWPVTVMLALIGPQTAAAVGAGRPQVIAAPAG